MPNTIENAENMIKANELRIGNLAAMPSSGEPTTITAMDISDIQSNLKNRLGIPLSEEWLLRFGFDKSYDNWGGYIAPKINGYSMRIRINTIGICYFSMNMVGKPIYIDYVHQLQNLYYALTQTELELKP